MTQKELAERLKVIPITVFTLIDAGTASSSAFQREPKSVHVRSESAFTMR